MFNSGGRAALAALVVAAAATGVAVAQEAPGSGASVRDAGWWNRLRPEVELPTGQPPAPPTPGVPEGSLVVAASVGDPAALAAVAIDVDHAPGATVESFTLTMREVDDDGANLDPASAAIVACPVTGYWLGGENGVWETQPAYDCEAASAPGTRGDDGTWTFDLRAIGQLWSDGDLGADGVALVEAVEAPASFRTVLAGLADGGIAVELVATGGDEGDDPFAVGSSGFSPSPSPSSGGSGGFSSSGSGGGFRLPTTAASTPPQPTPSDEAAAPAPADAPRAPDVEVPGIPVSGPGSPLGTLPWWSWPLLAAALGVALLAMVALGPTGEPVPTTSGGGVSRALEARTTSEDA